MKKGQTNNPNGRPKGVPNKVTGEAREWLSNLIDKNRATIEKDLQTLEPKDRLMMLEKLMSYIIPKQQAIQANISLDRLTDDQLDSVINEITKNIE